MHPILLQIGSFSLHTYGVLIALGFILGVTLAGREAERSGIDGQLVMDLAFWTVLGGFILSRVLFLAVNADTYWNMCFHPELAVPPLAEPDCLEAFKFWRGGLVFYGGLIGALLVGWFYLRNKPLSYWQAADILIPGVAIAHFFGRLGCFFAGCCWGHACDLPWAATFTDPDAAIRPLNMPVHPTQLYEAAGELAIFGTLIVMRRGKRFHGQLLLTYLILYPVLRSVVEIFRGDTERGFILSWTSDRMADGVVIATTTGISTSQFISGLVALAAVGLLAWRLKRAGRGMP